MMNVLIINASPRKNGFTTQALREIQAHIDSQHQCNWIDVNNLRLKPCQGCLRCRPDGECVMSRDDGHHVAQLIKNADALIIGSPTYFGNITGPLRTLIDRSLTALESIAANGLEMPTPLHTGKKAAIVTACAMPYPESLRPDQGAGALLALETTIKAGGYDLVGKLLIDGSASRKGLSAQIKTSAQDIAYHLFFQSKCKENHDMVE